MSAGPPQPGRARPLVEQPALALRAVEMLRTPQSLLPLSQAEAGQVAAQMGLVHFAAGSTVLREGDGSRPDYMLLLLEGEVEVDTSASGRRDRVALAVLGPGSIVGEMSLLDGAPRSATCTAVGPVLAAGLSRLGLERLIEEQPRAAAKLMTGLAQRMAERLRALGEQVQIYTELAQRGGPPGAG